MSKIPPYLLEGCSAQDKYIMENVFELKQKVGSLGDAVDRVESLQKIANGRTSKNESNVEILQKQIESWNNLKSNFLKSITNKYIIAGLGIGIFLCLYPFAVYISKSGGVIAFAE